MVKWMRRLKSILICDNCWITVIFSVEVSVFLVVYSTALSTSRAKTMKMMVVLDATLLVIG